MSLVSLLLAIVASQVAAPKESEYYAVDYLVPPDGAILEVGGIDFLPDGRLVVSTRRGQVWIVDNPLAKDPKDAKFHLFCEGLQEGLGLNVVDGEIYVLQRSELSRLRDTDKDGACDTIDTINNTWGVSGNYHEFAFGLPTDKDGNFYVSLNVGFGEPKWWHGMSLVPWRGWVVQISNSGVLTPFACGFRSPAGIGTNSAGDLFVTDNQGDWMPVCPLEHVKKDGFYGHPASLLWTDEYASSRGEPLSFTNPPDKRRNSPACWIPYKWSRSTGDMRSAPKDGSFGPFEDQLILAELTNGLVFRADLEKVRGEYQGAVMLLRQKVGSGVRVEFAKDGTLFVGMTNRGWGGLAPGHGIARVKWTGKTPFEIKHVHLLQDGFECELTEPLASDSKLTPANVELSLYHYDWWWEYGSPERQAGKLDVTKIEVSSDRRKITLRAPLVAGECARVVLKGLVSASGQPLLHDEFNYTINQLPDGPVCDTPIARLVPPPPARESQNEGWLRLTYGDALDLWDKHKGWKLVDAELDPQDPTKLVTKDGVNALVNGEGKAGDMESFPSFGDAKIHMTFMLPKGGATALMVQGTYGILLCDPGDSNELTTKSCGAIIGGEKWPGKAPALPVFRVPGESHDLDLVFRALRLDGDGKKIENARFVSVMVDDVLIHQEVELPEPSRGGLRQTEVGGGFGPLVVRGDLGSCAVGDIRVKPVIDEVDRELWTPLLADEGTEGWTATLGSDWKREDGVLVSGGKRGWLYSPKQVYWKFELHARCKISVGGMSAIWLRAQPGEDGPRGIAILINASHPDAWRTGTIAGSVTDASSGSVGPFDKKHSMPRLVSLVGADTWFDLRVRVLGDTDYTRVDVYINGAHINLADFESSSFGPGAIALEQHHEGSVLEIKQLEILEIERKPAKREFAPK